MPWVYSYWDVEEQATIVAVPDSNGIKSITLRRVFHCD